MEHKKINYKVPIPNHLLIRTGTLSDGSCFFHSLLTSVSSSYRNSSQLEKQNYNQRLRSQLSERFTENEWVAFDGMELLLQEKIYTDIEHLWKFPNLCATWIDAKYQKYAMEWIQQIPYSLLDNHILPRAFDIASKQRKYIQSSSEYINYIYTYIINYMRIYMSDHKIPPDTETLRDLETHDIPHVLFRHPQPYKYKGKYYKNTLKTLMKTLLTRSNQTVFETFKKNISSTNCWADNFYIKYASKILDVNILLVEDTTDSLYKMGYSIRKDKKCVILYYIEDAHFESVGLYNKKTKVIERSLEYTHPLIQSIMKS